MLKRFRSAALPGVLLACLWFLPRAQGAILLLPPSVVPEALSEAVPTAFEPVDFSTEDFALEWSGPTPEAPGLSAALEPGSLEWVRVSEELLVPRARVVIRGTAADGNPWEGTVRYAGFVQPFAEGEVKLPVALVSGNEHPIEVTARQSTTGRYIIRFKPRVQNASPVVLFDPSCSRYELRAEWPHPPVTGQRDPSWAYVGCRVVHTEAQAHRTSSLEMIVFWDNIGQKLQVSGVETPASSTSVWQLRLRSVPGYVDLGPLRLRYGVPEKLHHGAISLGVGPYSFSFKGNPDLQEDVSTWAMMPTLYASYFITETIRLVAFDATTLNSHFISDFGVYLSTEYLRNFDRRVVINLMLGVHSIGFRSQGKYHFLMGAPQGFEVIVSDIAGKARNLTLGGFIYPSIQGKSYYNTWVRWGSPALFGEINYISWQEKLQQVPYSASSLGLTIGVPLPALGFL